MLLGHKLLYKFNWTSRKISWGPFKLAKPQCQMVRSGKTSVGSGISKLKKNILHNLKNVFHNFNIECFLHEDFLQNSSICSYKIFFVSFCTLNFEVNSSKHLRT